MATTSRASRSFPTLSYLAAPIRWVLRSRRRAVTAAAVLLAMIVVPPIWWSLQLIGLPDIGDAFDVQAFRSFSIPDDRNAYVLYRQAADRLKPLNPPGELQKQQIDLGHSWSEADAAVRRWVEENREAMDLFRRGTERPDALEATLASSPYPPWVPTLSFSFHALALLEASRLEEPGDIAAAWTWYRAALRATYHLGLRGTITMRLIAQDRDSEFRRRFARWAADPRTTPDLLRQAINDVVAAGALAPLESYTLMAEYRSLESELIEPDSPGRQILIARLTAALRLHFFQLDPDQARAIADIWRFWRREPERSRRVLQLAIANRLAYEALPPDRRPPRDPTASGLFDLYVMGPEAPSKARALSPAALDRWLGSTADAQELLRRSDFQGLRMRDRAYHRALVLILASELYRREHGSDPPSDEALVGPYLKELPDDGLGHGGYPARLKAGEPARAPGSPRRED